MPTLPYPSWLTALSHWRGAQLNKPIHRINDARFRLHTEALRDLKGTTGNVVLWAPEAEPGENYVVEWSDAVAQVNKMVGPTTIKIISSNPSDDVYIPEGTWQLNETTLVGIAWDADYDTDFRGYQNLIDVFGTGNRTLLKGCVGLKDMYFRASDDDEDPWVLLNGDSGTFTAKALDTMTFTAGGGDTFTADDVGKPIRIGHVDPYNYYGDDTDETDNRGIFIITAVLGPTTIQFENASGVVADANNGDIGWSLCTSMFLSLNDGTKKKPFVLDNVDFRYNGDYDWGSFFVEDGVYGQFFVLKNAASVRWYAISVEGYIVVQSDGSPAWIGVDAFIGNGEVEMFPMAGTQVRPQYSIDTWTLHQPTTVYIPDNSGDWNGDVETIHAALDQLAARVRALET